MGKKKAVNEEVEKTVLSAYENKIIKDYGHVLIEAKSIKDEIKKVIPVGPVLDIGLNGGVPEGSWCIFSGPAKAGKAQPLYSMVYTPSGPKIMGCIKKGDVVCTPTGTSIVEDIFPQGKRPVYRIIFNDKSTTDCDIDHLWEVGHEDWNNNPKVLSTKELIEYFSMSGKKYFTVPYTKCDFDTQELTIDPYLFGVLLGDGILERCAFVSWDDEIVNNITHILKNDNNIYIYEYRPHHYNISSYNKNNYIRKYLQKTGLSQCRSWEKFIPTEYLYNSVKNRLSLLQGLLDTDGTIGKRGHVSFTTTSKQLSYDVELLVRSLGGICKTVERFTSFTYKNQKKIGRVSYRLNIKFKENLQLFRLSRKLNRVRYREKTPRRKIIKIIPIGNIETQCIKIQDPRGLYFTDNFIITHNTTLALQVAANAQKLYNKKVFMGDVEGRFENLHLHSVKDLNTDAVKVIKSNQKKILSAQEHLEIYKSILKNEPGCILIIDSSSALCAEEELTSDISATGRNNGPKLLASFCRQMGQVVPIQKSIVIIIQHLIANTSGYGSPFMEDGGNKIKYQSDIKLRCKSVKPWTDTEGKLIGQAVTWDILYSALGPPTGKHISYLKYGHGIDSSMEVLSLALELGIINKAGAWYKYKDESFQGEIKMYQYLKENPDIEAEVFKQIKEIL